MDSTNSRTDNPTKQTSKRSCKYDGLTLVLHMYLVVILEYPAKTTSICISLTKILSQRNSEYNTYYSTDKIFVRAIDTKFVKIVSLLETIFP